MERVTKSQREAAAKLVVNQIDDLVKQQNRRADASFTARKNAIKAAWLLTEEGKAYARRAELIKRAQELAQQSQQLYNEAGDLARVVLGTNYYSNVDAHVDELLTTKTLAETALSEEELALTRLKMVQRDAYNRVIVGNDTDLLALIEQIVSEARAALE